MSELFTPTPEAMAERYGTQYALATEDARRNSVRSRAHYEALAQASYIELMAMPMIAENRMVPNGNERLPVYRADLWDIFQEARIAEQRRLREQARPKRPTATS